MGQTGKWYKLDNAAAIIPSSVSGADTRVFRIVCELKEEVDGGILQEALDHILPGFPHFLCELRKGLFWYYLDSVDIRPMVEEDRLSACSPIYFDGRRNLLFRVNYYRKRINLEMFHVLSDGTGAFVFFRALILSYLSIKHNLKLEYETEEKSSATEKSTDAFRKYYQRQKGLGQLKAMTLKRAYQLKGDPDDNLLPHLLEATIPLSRFAAAAKERSVSIGVFLVSLYIDAVIDEMTLKERNQPIVVSVPVDLRRYFPSDTTRNFFGVINISYSPEQFDGNLESIICRVKESFTTLLKPEQISQVMNSYEELEHNMAIKMVPLFIKDIGTNRLNYLASKGVTGTISNLGVIRMPEAAEPYIEKFSAFTTAPSEQISIVSFADKMVLGEVSPFTTHEIMLHFLRRLVEMDIPVELATNDYEVE